ncbi:DUF4446 family protein [Clostridium luticellarii]|nr:DUF4446 family protein [Clostridium luticellarii]MCI1945857.1 DUF4446 family protein [Clostridium luticellarii]MCI1969189.1 DUF4446 family protein [Clostridium luticellarii]MCI1996167.1 DUF4446 family protein [Clostridium luticellarii]MCI2040500.1 DUF4446 family protein [Clostridium luticellarii]
MQNIINLINEFQLYIVIGLVVLIIILIIMNTIIFKSLNRLEKRYRKLMRGTNNKNLEELIMKYLDNIDNVKKQSEDIKKLYDNLNSRVKYCIQKISIIRYRAFEDVGSDLSFSIALLDENNDGVIITGIYGRDESTTYAKPVDSGMSRYELSQEEKQVLVECMNKRI